MSLFPGPYSFAPTNLPPSINTQSPIYYFPPVSADNNDKRVFHMNQTGDAFTPMTMMQGYWAELGTAPAAPGTADFSVTFVFIPTWVSNNPNMTANGINGTKNGYGTGLVGLEAALTDFWSYIVMSGLGTLTDNLISGTGLRNGAKTDKRVAQAQVNGDVTVTRIAGMYATVDLTFTIPSGQWVLDNGTPMFFY